MNLPAYINFYNVQDVDGTTIPNKAEGSLEFANNLWGTFLDVDYRKASSKMVCFYVGKPSQYLELPKGNFRFRDDAFDMSRASENPLIENYVGKKDWGVSNKCVGFTVDIGTRNQNVFYSFSVSQDNGTATSESISTQLNMVDQASGKNVATQNAGLYNLYKQRSYKCSVVCLGNALLQPTMYFNLRHVPMFNGPYMIQQVEHSIQPGQFQTTFQGIRQGVYDLPAIDNFIQSINQNLLTKVEELLKIKKDTINVLSASTESNKSNNTVQSANNTQGTTNECESKVLPIYLNKRYQSTNAVLTEMTPTKFSAELKRIMPNNLELATIIYCISYIRTFQKDSNSGLGKFNGWNKIGFQFERNTHNAELYDLYKDYSKPNLTKWVDFGFRLLYDRPYKKLFISTTFAIKRSFNYKWSQPSDASGLGFSNPNDLNSFLFKISFLECCLFKSMPFKSSKILPLLIS